jgi:tRNA modification GTPase
MVDGTGLDRVEDTIYNLVYSGEIGPKNSVLITNNRHKEALIRAERYLGEALQAMDASVPLDRTTTCLRR